MPGTATATPPREAFDLREALASPIQEAAIAADGTAKLHIIRPCIGQGQGKHLYESDMLRENAHKFAGWRMYLDHRSPAAQRAAAGLPRSVRDLAGRIIESKWDASVPADPAKGFGPGAVVGTIRPVRVARELLEEDPELLEASINAHATSIRPVTRDGEQVWLVEGIEDRGSVDFVTEGGAGGRVAPLLEAAYHDPRDEELALFESMTDQELSEELRRSRPQLAEALRIPDPTPPPDGGRRETDVPEQNPTEVLQEALRTDEGREAVQSLFRDELSSAMDEERSRLREENDSALAEARAESDRRDWLRRSRDRARTLIEGADDLPDGFRGDLESRFDLDDRGRPTPELNVFDELDGEGQVTRRADEVLTESVEAAIETSRNLLREARGEKPRVEGQGPDGGEGGAGEGGEGGKPAAPEKTPLWKTSLQEASIDPDEAWNDTPPPAQTPEPAAAAATAE